jgi:Zn-dependent protease with chaperone function
MGFLKHRGRVLIEFVGLMYGAFMTLLAIIEWAGRYSWRLAPSSLLIMAGIALLVVIYLVLDEIRLNTQH